MTSHCKEELSRSWLCEVMCAMQAAHMTFLDRFPNERIGGERCQSKHQTGRQRKATVNLHLATRRKERERESVHVRLRAKRKRNSLTHVKTELRVCIHFSFHVHKDNSLPMVRQFKLGLFSMKKIQHDLFHSVRGKRLCLRLLATMK